MLDIAADPGIFAVLAGRSGDPFAVLGRHGEVVRALLPGATAVELVSPEGRNLAAMTLEDPAGLFEGRIAPNAAYRFRIDWNGVVQETEDPYSFGLQLGELDLHLLAEGRHHRMADCLGSHAIDVDGVSGVRFAVWAPNASRVSVVGDFNAWDERRHPMRRRLEAGIWELFIPRLDVGAVYKYALIGPHGDSLPFKADPVAGMAERAPKTGSIVPPRTQPIWTDQQWLHERSGRSAISAPISVYEVHATSWMRADGGSLNWDALGEKLIPYAVGMGFTHLELMPIMVHPFGGSWGYQPLGQFAPLAELGTPDDFARFVDACHRAQLGVILDWVPAHFPADTHGLALFDGTPLYEHADPREGFHQDWNTLIYNLGRHEVRGFLIASALQWLEHFHVDALRVDAVASMLYRDYSRKQGEWVPNVHGGRENLEAVAFFRELSQVVGARCPGALLIAEESTAWPGVTTPVGAPDDHGMALGFDYKWNMGWMNDTLRYMHQDPINRSYHHGEMTFGMVYAFTEKFILPISHDEVVHGKGSLLGKMPGDLWQQFANLRAYLGFMWGHPGKKLLFMGCEFAQPREWNHDVSLDWHLLDAPMHHGVQRLVRDLNGLYRQLPALHRFDCQAEGFRWVVGDDRAQSVFAFLREGGAGEAAVLVVCNMTPVPRVDYRIGLPSTGAWIEAFNSDADVYGGSGMGNSGRVMAESHGFHDLPASALVCLPPLSTLILTREAG